MILQVKGQFVYILMKTIFFFSGEKCSIIKIIMVKTGKMAIKNNLPKNDVSFVNFLYIFSERQGK